MSLSTKDTQMKHALGRIAIILSMQLYLFADVDLARYTLTSSSYEVYQKQAIEITFSATQVDHDDEMFFFLDSVESDSYKILLLDKKTQELGYHDRKTTFRYLVFPLSSGSVSIDFDFTIKVASDEAVAQVYRGSRDNVKWIETINTKVDVKPLIIDVKALKEGIELVGDFRIDTKLKNSKIDAYQSANIAYTLSGVGYDEVDINPISEIAGVEIFKELTLKDARATKDGYKIEKTFNYALVANKSFSIDAKKINCFSPKSSKYYTIDLNKQNIEVTKLEMLEVLDDENYPKQESSFSTFKEFLIYLIIFLTGYASAKITPNIKSKTTQKKSHTEIRDASTPKELLFVLANNYSKYDFKDECSKLEEMVYKKGASNYNFSLIKKSVLEML